MKLINQSFEIINQTDFSLKGILKHIERCARVSYKSEQNITEDSYKKFTDMLIARGHDRPLEFGTVHLKMDFNSYDLMTDTLVNKGILNQLWIKEVHKCGNVYITTNYRYYLTIKKFYPDVEKFFTEEDNKYFPKRYTVHMILSRGVMDEFRTHVGLSHLAESTRYCVSGDTKLTYKNPHNSYTIKELWEDRQSRNKKSKILIEVLNLDTGILEYTTIKNIFNNGIKKTYKITTELGYTLRCTLDHQLYTPEGWRPLKDLKINSDIYVNGVTGLLYQNKDWLNYQYIQNNKTVSEICKEFGFKQDVIRKWLHKFQLIKPKEENQLYKDYNWLYEQNIVLNKTFVDISKEFNYNVSTLKKWAKKLGLPQKGTGYFNIGRVPWNKGLSEEDDDRVKTQTNALRKYHHNGDSNEKILKEDTSEYQKYLKSKCEVCGSLKDLEVHHKDKNHSNNDPNNLITVCSSCHQKIHHQSLTSLHIDKIISITECEEEEVFDLEIEKYHNYVANGIIAHNCNYSKGKFGGEVTFIKPNWYVETSRQVVINHPELPELPELGCSLDLDKALTEAETAYLSLLKNGCQPQEAREVLPLAVKSELISCGFEDAWENFFMRRDASDAHPMAQEIAKPLHQAFIKLGYINDNRNQ